MRRLSQGAFLLINLFVLAFTFTNVFLINGVYSMSLLEAPVWLYLLPSFVLYILYAHFALISFVLKTSKFATIRQEALLERLNYLNSKLRLRRRNLSSRKSRKYWFSFYTLNKSVIGLAGHLEAYSRYWSPFLSVYFAEQITLQCYLAYICLFAHHRMHWLLRGTFFYTILEIDLLLFLLINYCAQVVRANRAFELANGTFFRRFFRLGGFKRVGGGFSSKIILKVRNDFSVICAFCESKFKTI